MLSNENVCCHAHQALIEFGFGKDDTWAHFAPMYHLVDAYAIFSITWVGGTHTLLPTWDARAALHQMATYRVTTTHVAATMLQMLITNPERAKVRQMGFDAPRVPLMCFCRLPNCTCRHLCACSV